MNKFFIIFAIVSLFAMQSYNFLSERSEQTPAESTLENQEPIEPPPPATPQPMAYAVIFKSFDRATLSSLVTSTVIKITHRMGEYFRAGELLVLLDDTVFQGLLFKAKGTLEKAKAELEAKQNLYSQEIASLFELKTAQANVAIATSDVISAEHAIKACHITAPYNGKVVQLYVEEAELIQEGKPLMEIVNDEHLIGQVLIPANAANIKTISLGKPLKISINETGETVMGKIFRVSPIIDPASSLIKIDVLVDNKEGNLRSGMIGSTILEEENQPKPGAAQE